MCAILWKYPWDHLDDIVDISTGKDIDGVSEGLKSTIVCLGYTFIGFAFEFIENKCITVATIVLPLAKKRDLPCACFSTLLLLHKT